MTKYRKKPIVIEAVQYSGDNFIEINDFTKGKARTNTCYDHLTIPTLEGDMIAGVGDWIIKGVYGEFYPVKPDIFEETYDQNHECSINSQNHECDPLIDIPVVAHRCNTCGRLHVYEVIIATEGAPYKLRMVGSIEVPE